MCVCVCVWFVCVYMCVILKVWRGLSIEYSNMLFRLNNPLEVYPVYYPNENRLYVPLSMIYDSILPNSEKHNCEIGKRLMSLAADNGVKIVCVGGILEAFDYKNISYYENGIFKDVDELLEVYDTEVKQVEKAVDRVIYSIESTEGTKSNEIEFKMKMTKYIRTADSLKLHYSYYSAVKLVGVRNLTVSCGEELQKYFIGEYSFSHCTNTSQERIKIGTIKSDFLSPELRFEMSLLRFPLFRRLHNCTPVIVSRHI
eukprot:GHVR01116780.1.p1 GENE.GHVR01116780.1~~GHVR01116780.1.p1  ORF type:complete len:256 (-),score=31.66 GHVR01116780.1:305-1072(-)